MEELKAQIRTAIQEAWNNNLVMAHDTYDCFLNTAAEAVYQLVAEEHRIAEAIRECQANINNR